MMMQASNERKKKKSQDAPKRWAYCIAGKINDEICTYANKNDNNSNNKTVPVVMTPRRDRIIYFLKTA